MMNYSNIEKIYRYNTMDIVSVDQSPNRNLSVPSMGFMEDTSKIAEYIQNVGVRCGWEFSERFGLTTMYVNSLSIRRAISVWVTEKETAPTKKYSRTLI